MQHRFSYLALMTVGILLLGVGIVGASPPAQDDADADLVARGEYLVKIVGCDACHTPFQEQYNDFANIALEDIQTLAFNEHDALDEEKYMAGGRVFDLGPAGVVISRNLTPDEETGLGAWTDEEIKAAIQTGIARDGHQLFPLMPYFTFNRMADSDLDAIVAYLRTLEPVSNDVGPYTMAVPPFGLTAPEEPIQVPDPSDQDAYGEYLVASVLSCTDCHTPLDEATGSPDMTRFLGGGQPFEGPWGIVYGGNITPHEETGLGSWTEEDLVRAIATGVRPDGRRLILMPWEAYSNMTSEDITAVAHYLKNVLPAVDNEVPAPSLNPEFEAFVEAE